MLKKSIFALFIFILSTLIFIFSSHFSQHIRPVKQQTQTFVEAKVLDIIREDVESDRRIPSIKTGVQQLEVEILEGDELGKVIQLTNPLSRLHNVYVEQGDEFVLMVRHTKQGTSYWAYNHLRSYALYALFALFVLLLVWFGGRAGVHALISLYFTAALIIGVLVPSLFAGIHPLIVTTILITLKVIVNYILVCGYNLKSGCAMLGTLLGVVAAGLVAQIFGEFSHLSGMYLDKSEDVIYLSSQPINIAWLLFTAIMISALGAVMDVAISIASAYHELQEKSPHLAVSELRQAAMNIGKDIMGTMTNTLILAIAGGMLTSMMMVWGFDMPLMQLMNTPFVGVALVQALAGSVGIVLTIPFTAFVCSWMYPRFYASRG